MKRSILIDVGENTQYRRGTECQRGGKTTYTLGDILGILKYFEWVF